MRLNVQVGVAIKRNEDGLTYYAGHINGDFLTVCYRDGREFETIHETVAERSYQRLFDVPVIKDFKYKPEVSATLISENALMYKGEVFLRLQPGKRA